MTAYYNEIDPKAAAWLRELIKRNLIAPGEVDERSIIDVHPDDLRGFIQCHFFAGIGVWSYALRQAGWSDDRPVWTGSCPCQPFSAAGKGDEFGDERHLWPAWFRLIRECRPVAVFGEQVASKDALSWLDHVSTDLEAEGYAVGAVDTCAAGFGAPHIRQRLYFVAAAQCEQEYEEQQRPAANERERGTDSTGGCGMAGRMADPDGRNASTEREQRSGEQRLLAQGGGTGEPLADTPNADRRRGEEEGTRPDGERRRRSTSGSATGVAQGDAIEQGPQGHAGNGNDRDESGRIGTDAARPVAEAGPTNGFWSNAEWIPCRDGKARPVKSGSFPLVTGAPARVVRLRGYGNAINAEQARHFIEAYQEVRAA